MIKYLVYDRVQIDELIILPKSHNFKTSAMYVARLVYLTQSTPWDLMIRSFMMCYPLIGQEMLSDVDWAKERVELI